MHQSRCDFTVKQRGILCAKRLNLIGAQPAQQSAAIQFFRIDHLKPISPDIYRDNQISQIKRIEHIRCIDRKIRIAKAKLINHVGGLIGITKDTGHRMRDFGTECRGQGVRDMRLIPGLNKHIAITKLRNNRRDVSRSGNFPEVCSRKRMTTSLDTRSSQIPAQDHAGRSMVGKEGVCGIKIGVVQLSVLHIGGPFLWGSGRCQPLELAQKKDRSISGP